MKKLTTRIFGVYNRFLQRHSNLVFRPILDTSPLATDPDSDTLVFTILDKKNYRAYLVAAKSLLQYCPPIQVVVQDDGTLDASSRADLQHHLPGIVIHDREDSLALVRRTAPPELLRMLDFDGSCDFFIRLRLLNVLSRYRGKKIIIMDSDLVFLRRPDYVVRWIEEGRRSAFHSDGGSFQVRDFHALGFDYSRVDIARFNAGFTGFYHDVDLATLGRIVETIYTGNPRLLREYEICQSLWATLFATFHDVVCLDDVIKDYVASGYWSYERMRRSVLVHFIGSVRFKGLNYMRLSRQVVYQLKHRQGALT